MTDKTTDGGEDLNDLNNYCPKDFPFVISDSNIAIIRMESYRGRSGVVNRWRVSIGYAQFASRVRRKASKKYIEVKTFKSRFLSFEEALRYAAKLGFGEAVWKKNPGSRYWYSERLPLNEMDS